MTEVFPSSRFHESPAFLMLDESALIADEKCFGGIEENAIPAGQATVLAPQVRPETSCAFSPAFPGVVAVSDSEDDDSCVPQDNSNDEDSGDNERGNSIVNAEMTSSQTEPTATALPIALALTPQVDPSCSIWTRPEYLFAKFYKPTSQSPTGIVLKSRGSAVVISRIEPGSLVSRTNLCPGDRIMSVNGVSCLDLSPEKVAGLIRDALCDVSITVRNKHGNPVLVSTCVQKRFPTQKCGIAFQNKRGALFISRVEVDGLFGNSLLMPGHRCCYINDQVCANSHQISSRLAADLVSQTPHFVSFISKPDHAMAMVLACESNNVWFRNMAIGFGLASGAMSAMR